MQVVLDLPDSTNKNGTQPIAKERLVSVMSKVKLSETLLQKLNGEWKFSSKCPCLQECIHTRTFYNTKKLHAWMKEEDTTGNTNFWRLHEEIVHDRPNFYQPKENFDRKDNYFLVFSLLHQKNQAKLFPFFFKAGLDDEKLSNLEYDWKGLKDEFTQDPGFKHNNVNQFLEQIDEERWKFYPLELNFEVQSYSKFHYKQRLPFIEIQTIKLGGQASVFEVAVLADFVPEEIREHLGEPYETRHAQCYGFALKSYSANQYSAFSTEGEAFQGLDDKQGFIRHFGRYKHAHNESLDNGYAYFILLELGLYDLGEYFSKKPPSSPNEIVDIWEKLCVVATSLRSLHQLWHKGEVYLGWHSDIKPENILNNGEFKLADFGLTQFIRASKAQQGSETHPGGGTMAYGAPEVARASKRPQNCSLDQKIDIWSFGCVLSVAATWILRGSRGVEEFKKLRQDANGEDNSDSFHDGRQLLTEIYDWHQGLKNDIRPGDKITLQILRLIECHMLLRNPRQRISSQDLCTFLNNLLGLDSRAFVRQRMGTTQAKQQALEICSDIHSAENSTESFSLRPQPYELAHHSSSKTNSRASGIPEKGPSDASDFKKNQKQIQDKRLHPDHSALQHDIFQDGSSFSRESHGGVRLESSLPSSRKSSARGTNPIDKRHLFQAIQGASEQDVPMFLSEALETCPESIGSLDTRNRSLMTVAVRNRKKGIVRKLLGPDFRYMLPDPMNSDEDGTLLHHMLTGFPCINESDIQSRELFLDLLHWIDDRMPSKEARVAFFNRPDRNSTPLQLCVSRRLADHAEEFLKRGACENEDGKRLLCSLKNAIKRRDVPMVQLLLKHGADFDWEDDLCEVEMSHRIKEILRKKKSKPPRFRFSGRFKIVKEHGLMKNLAPVP